MNKDDIRDKVVISIYFLIGAIPIILIVLSFFPNNSNDTQLIIDKKTTIEVCDSKFMLSDYTEGEELYSSWLEEDIKEVCSNYYADVLREEIEEEIKEEIKDK